MTVHRMASPMSVVSQLGGHREAKVLAQCHIESGWLPEHRSKQGRKAEKGKGKASQEKKAPKDGDLEIRDRDPERERQKEKQ